MSQAPSNGFLLWVRGARRSGAKLGHEPEETRQRCRKPQPKPFGDQTRRAYEALHLKCGCQPHPFRETFGRLAISRDMKNVVIAGLLVAVLTSGCLTSQTIEAAKGEHYTCKTPEGERTVDKKPHPAMYTVVPFAVIGDVILVPIYWIPVTIAVNLGLMEPPF